MDAKRILFITQELSPYLPESEIATISRHLPPGIQERGREIRTFMPRYGSINERRNQLHEVIRLSGMNLIIDDTDHPLIIKVASLQAARMQVYFIDNDDFSNKKAPFFNEDGTEYADNDERSIFFVRGVLETVKKLRWNPDLIHCHGWMTALSALYVKKHYCDSPCFSKAKVVYSIYENGYNTPFNESFIKKVMVPGIEENDISPILEKQDYASLNKLAIDHCDGVIQGSKNIDKEVVEYAAKSGKPFLPYQGEEDYIPAFDDFYNEIMQQ
ncbi:MAG: glycogen/starch synthase [Bacteroidales bacterium]|nr:glycogen/starch synthase [Bacteroidales bacterium]